MTKYIVSVMIPFIPEDLKKQVLAAERERVKELKKQNVIQELLISKEQNSAWMIINSDNGEINTILESLPIFPYLYVDKIVELLDNTTGPLN